MAVTRRIIRRKRRLMSRKQRPNSKKKRFMRYRGKGVYLRPPSYLPIPPPRAPSLPIPPPLAPSLPRPPASNLPIPPPPKPLFIEPSPNHFIIRSQSPPYISQKKPKAKQPKSEPLKLVIEPKPALEPEEPKQRRSSLRQLIIRSDQTNTKVKRK